MACGEIALFVLNPKTRTHVHTHMYGHKFLKYVNIFDIPYSVAEGKDKINKILPVTAVEINRSLNLSQSLVILH